MKNRIIEETKSIREDIKKSITKLRDELLEEYGENIDDPTIKVNVVYKDQYLIECSIDADQDDGYELEISEL